MRWIGEAGSADDAATWLPLTDELRTGAAGLGAVMVLGDAPRDPNGLPYQFVVRTDEEEGVVGLLTDHAGHPLTWVLTADGTDDIRDEAGRPALRPAPPEIAREAWDWLAGGPTGPVAPGR